MKKERWERRVLLQPRLITPSEISIILHMIRKPNSITVLLFIQKNSQFKNIAKTCLPPSMFSSSSIVYVQVCPAPQIFSKQQMSPIELSSCCSCHVFSYFFAQFLLLKQVKCPPFFKFTTKTAQPRPQVLLGSCCGLYVVVCYKNNNLTTFIFYVLLFFG